MGTKKNFRLPIAPAIRGERLDFIVWIGALALLALSLAPHVLAANGRDFAGFYRYEKTADLDQQKQVTLTLRLFNYSGANVSGAVVTLQGALPTGPGYGSITGVSVDDGGRTAITGSFTIPDNEYQRWQAGALPRIYIEYTDTAGNQMRRPIEIISAPMGERP